MASAEERLAVMNTIEGMLQGAEVATPDNLDRLYESNYEDMQYFMQSDEWAGVVQMNTNRQERLVNALLQSQEV